jgi:hypothetical protein
MPVTKRFRAVLEKDEDSSGTAISIPFDVEKVFGKRGRVPVRGTINGVAYRSSIFPMGRDCHLMVVNRQMREAAGGLDPGETVSVVMERDDEPRTVTVPEDLDRALRAEDGLLATWEKLSFTHKREHVQAIEEAKRPETRTRRIEKAIEHLKSKAKK